MKKRKKSKLLQTPVTQNPVAKFAHQFNKSQRFNDKTKYSRRNKHKGQEPFTMCFLNALQKAFA